MKFDLEVIREPERFRALESAWDELFERLGCPHFFLRFAWVWSAWEENSEPKCRKLFVMVGRVDERVVLIWPLMIQNRSLARFLASNRGEYRDVLVEEGPHTKDWLTIAFDRLYSERGLDILQLQDVREQSPLTRLFQAPQFRAKKRVREAPFVRLDAWSTFSDYIAALPGKLRRDQRRQWRRIAEDSQAEFRTVTDLDETLQIVHWLYEKKLAWLVRHDMASPSFSCPEYFNFLLQVTRDAHADGCLLVTAIVAGDEFVSASISFPHNGEFSFYMFSYDQRWESYSPGRLLIEKNLEWAKSNNMSRFDFMLGTLDFKERWTDEAAPINDYLIPCSAVGVVMIGWYRSRLRRWFLNYWWQNSPRRFLAGIPRPIRTAGEIALLSRWGDPYQDT